MSGAITIVGGGVAGLTAAWELSRRGADVTLWDRTGGVTGPHHCSWWAGGMLAPFCEAESAEPQVALWGADAADWWERATGGVTRRGSLVVSLARDRAELTRFARRTDAHEMLDAEGIAALEPDLAGRVSRGLYFATEAHLAPRVALATLRDRLVAAGVHFHTGEADPAALPGLVVDTRGFAARPALPVLRGVKGEMLMLSCPDVALSRPVRLLHPRIPIYLVPRGGGVYMLGATQIEAAAGGTRARLRSLVELMSAAYALNPAFGEAEVMEIGVDSRPAFPDNLPRATREGRVIRANGLFRHGFLLGPWLARQVAALALDEEMRDAG